MSIMNLFTNTHIHTHIYMLWEQVCFPIMNRVLVFGRETLHYSIVMTSFIASLMTSWIFLKAINKCMLKSGVHNTARFQ